MALDTYANFQLAIANMAHRSDLTAVLPDLIALAEVRINGDIDARMQDVKTTLSTVANVETIALPSDCINIRHLSVAVAPVQTLQYETPDTLYVANSSGVAGVPNAYTVSGSTAILRPIPDAVYTLDIIYKGRVPALSATNTTNYLLTTYPKVYVAAVMLEVGQYTRDAALETQWEAQYRLAIQSVNSQDWSIASTMRVKSDVRL